MPSGDEAIDSDSELELEGAVKSGDDIDEDPIGTDESDSEPAKKGSAAQKAWRKAMRSKDQDDEAVWRLKDKVSAKSDGRTISGIFEW